MELLFVLSYTAFCVAVFKIFKIPLNKWTVPTAILSGVAIIFIAVLIMNYNHPYTEIARTSVATTPVVPLVKGRVIEVPIKANQQVKKGDVLYKMDPTPYQARVDKLTAQLVDSSQDVVGLDVLWIEAKANVENKRAIMNKEHDNYMRYENVVNKAKREGRTPTYSAADLSNKKQDYIAAKANFDAAEAEEDQARVEVESLVSGENTIVAQIRADLNEARFNLEQTIVRAPTDGMVAQLFLRPGMVAVTLPLRPTMVFVHKAEPKIIGSFVQNSILRIQEGNRAEVIFPSVPGHVFKGRVDFIQRIMAEGELQARGNIVKFGNVSSGRIPVMITLDDDISHLKLPVGVSAEIAIYTEHFEHLSALRKILLRMKSWQNYMFGPVH